jgi:cyclopropane-fatty-acyl-phospholipid synthase
VSSPGTTLSGPAVGASPPRRARGAPRLPRRYFPRLLQRYLQNLEIGALRLTLPSGATIEHKGARPGPEAVLVLRRWRALWRIMIEGDLGLARAYMDDDCRSPDIKALLDFGTQNETALAKATSGAFLLRLLDRLRHARRANTRRGSRRNIAAHYDLGNAFYAQWLDAGMNYSSAYYTREGQTLEEAQDAKLNRIAALLDLRPEHRVLEIGCGWGPLVERLIERHGCHVTGLTLSAEQLAFARARLRRRNFDKCADLRFQDYRDVGGRFDRIVSVEMLEAVGERFWPAYFGKLRQALTDTGTAVLQAITIAEHRFANYRRQPDFIQRYIFPGGMLPTMDIIRCEAARAGLRLVAHESFGSSYARTLAEWRRRFLQMWPDIETLGFDLRFKRMWEYYLSYCEVGFAAGAVDVNLLKLAPSG